MLCQGTAVLGRRFQLISSNKITVISPGAFKAKRSNDKCAPDYRIV